VTLRAGDGGLLPSGSLSSGGLPSDWLVMGCTPTALPRSCGARQGFGWVEDAVERCDDSRERG
jgi:hypothetical protein